MKKILILLAAVLAISTQNTTAQVRGMKDLLIGPVVGGGGNRISNLNRIQGTQKIMPSAYAGINVTAFSSEHFAWTFQAVASAEGYMQDINGIKQVERPLYLRVPIRAMYVFNSRYDKVRPNIHIGPSMAFKLGEQSIQTLPNNEVKKIPQYEFTDYDLGVEAGAGVNIRLASRLSINLDISYINGLSDVVDDPIGFSNVNENLDISAGLLLRINK